MKTEHLRKEIEKMFSFIDKPKGLTLSFHKAECFQFDALRVDLKKYKGKALPAEGIREIHQEMYCLSPQGWRWVMPFYLLYCLTQEAALSQMETEFLIYNLAPDPKHHLETKERLSSLNQDQLLCLVHFLEWCKSHEYWSGYCPKEIDAGISFLSTILE